MGDWGDGRLPNNPFGQTEFRTIQNMASRCQGSGWDIGIEDLWYSGLYGEAEHALDVIKRCGLPRAVFAEAESDFERDDEEFQGLGGMGDGDGDD